MLKQIPFKIKIIALILVILMVSSILVAGIVKSIPAKGVYTDSTYSGMWFSDENGTEYMPSPYCVNVLVMGIDSDEYIEGNKERADMLCLYSFDVLTRECTILHINRDTMVDLSPFFGDKEYEKVQQICLSYWFGDNPKERSTNTKSAVSSLLMGLPIDYYMAIHMDGIDVINDFVGGVEVTIQDDFGDVKPEWKIGDTVTLMGDDVETFVRERRAMASEKTNQNRMKRQDQFMSALWPKLIAKSDDCAELFLQLDSYLTTNFSVTSLENFFKDRQQYTMKDVGTLSGESKIVNNYMQFWVDEEGVKKLLMDSQLFVPQ